jgi:hypothetical protein
MTIKITVGGGQFAENAIPSHPSIRLLLLLALLIHRVTVQILKPTMRVKRKRIPVSGIKNVIMGSLVHIMSYKTGAADGVLALPKGRVKFKRAGVAITSGLETRVTRKPVARGME